MPEITFAEAAGLGVDGKPRPSEDIVVVLPDAVVVLDGATSLRPDLPSGGAYAAELAAQLAGRLSAAPELDLADHLAASIRSVARGNGFTPGDSPASTVAIVRWNAAEVEALVLADTPVVAFTPEPQVVADLRLSQLPKGSYRDRLRQGGGYSPEHLAALRASSRKTSALRNKEGGYWVAEAVPAAARQAIRATWPRDSVTATLIATDGVACGIDQYNLFDWPEALRLCQTTGPQSVLDAVRAAESTDPHGIRWPRPKPHDDQALVLITF
ncbi:hypothetical protein V5P93_007017 [Actinokineospora auranticolor]|uniref:Protein phosphatase 2C-like protein n=1 Tax=Actinokineospora auranticolor TaxID=155976 RepID=A0A2S6GH13_9PSEU|nr:hypothetical protein [Actinokineospora auranticolor]PPK64528.1 hypothetical protein CLV40_11995 [Actinokineospora auranticolor]